MLLGLSKIIECPGESVSFSTSVDLSDLRFGTSYPVSEPVLASGTVRNTAGVLVMNLKEFRESRIEEKFIDLITKYDFDLLDPDQAYLNYLCRDKICIIPCSWNKEPIIGEDNCEKKIVHYALYKKPWQYDDVIDGDFFWHYAETSPFFGEILRAGEVVERCHEAERRRVLNALLDSLILNVDQLHSLPERIIRITEKVAPVLVFGEDHTLTSLDRCKLTVSELIPQP